MFNSSAQIPVQKTILIILVSSFILISFLIILVPYSNIYIDDKKINTQISIEKILNCFSDDVGIIDTDKYSSEELNSCLKNQDNILVKVKLQERNEIYLNEDKINFENKKEIACNVNSNVLCTEMAYPVVVRSNDASEIKILEVKILSE